jgi:hypothetical protein
LYSDNNNYSKYDKVKHLVEINDNILAVFVINSSNQMEGIHIAKNAGIDKSTIEQIFDSVLLTEIESKEKYLEKNLNDLKNILDSLLWEVSEYRKLRILKIYEKGKVIMVLIKSNTKLEHTIDNVLGYYFESDDDDDSETPKSLF